MSKPDPQSHHRRNLDEFTRRVEAFATVPAITNAEALNLLVRMSGAGPQDTVLDVACGAGLVVCAFAPVVRQATVIDFTPAMIKRGAAWNKSSTGLGGFPPSLNRESESSPDFLLRFTWLRSGKGGESVSDCSRTL